MYLDELHTNTCSAQKTIKQPSCVAVMPSAGITAAAPAALFNKPPSPPATATSIWCMLLPPIQVCMPNQAHATRARVSDGRLAPCSKQLEHVAVGAAAAAQAVMTSAAVTVSCCSCPCCLCGWLRGECMTLLSWKCQGCVDVRRSAVPPHTLPSASAMQQCAVLYFPAAALIVCCHACVCVCMHCCHHQSKAVSSLP